ncbi:hypothetical protein SDC9_170983 [bioreactor metagenome]|uniref:Uncharacterized protein n=1 Tax=bioreactor metagenome TaxID=1076179 RepID=A0A645G9L1_9ZZZZ
MNDSYLEIEEFDESVMIHHPEKIGSKEYSKYADLDQVCVDRFNRIIARQ